MNPVAPRSGEQLPKAPAALAKAGCASLLDRALRLRPTPSA